MTRMDEVLKRIDAGLPQSLARLGELLRIPSVSADPAHDGDCRRAAVWVRAAVTASC